jgi:hypothetical protein
MSTTTATPRRGVSAHALFVVPTKSRALAPQVWAPEPGHPACSLKRQSREPKLATPGVAENQGWSAHVR